MFIRYSVPYSAASLKINSIIFSIYLDLHWTPKLNRKISLLLENLAHHWRPHYIIKDHINIIGDQTISLKNLDHHCRLHNIFGDHINIIGDHTISLETTQYHWRPHKYHWRPHNIIGDHTISLETA